MTYTEECIRSSIPDNEKTIVVEVLPLDGENRRRVVVRCPVCGETRKMFYNNLVRRGSTRCNHCKQIDRIKNLIGTRYGRLTVLSLSDKKDRWKGAIWACRCDCGNIVEVRSTSLIQGKTRSCGRLSIERTRSRVGDKNPAWNPNLTDEDHNRNRVDKKRKQWSFKVKENHNFTCGICGDSRGGNLVSHHLDGWNLRPDKRYDVSNGVCLCESCHDKFHMAYGFGNNTHNQYNEFCAGRA